jgi:protein-S-isoprenylcysteine O-methyltransferase Ste14
MAMMLHQSLTLCLLLICWCALHSFLITPSVTTFFHRNMKGTFRFYRLFFNTVSALTLIPVALYAYSLRTETILSWHGYWRIFQILLLVVSLTLFFFGTRRYDANVFLGITQIRTREESSGSLAETGKLDTSGILSVVRHPWYLAGILILWARDLDISTILVNSVFCIYFIVGAVLEEKKLVKEFGEQYLAYQKRVPMFIPGKFWKS